MKTFAETDLSYLAGMIDADGWFSVLRCARKKHWQSVSYSPSIGISNTSIRLMDWLSDSFGGHVKRHSPQKHAFGKKPIYEWRMRIEEMKELLPLIAPFLKIKQEQATIIGSLLLTFDSKHRGRGVPESVLNERERLYMMIRKLNGTNHAIVRILEKRAVA